MNCVEESTNNDEDIQKLKQIEKDISVLESRKSRMTDMLIADIITKGAYDVKLTEVMRKLHICIEKKLLLQESISKQKDVGKQMFRCLLKRQNEINILDTFLYEAIFIPKGVSTPSKDIIYQPELQVYVKDFGKVKGDFGLVAQVEDKIVGAVWDRIIDDYGHVDNETPSFAVSLLKEYRNYGIGTELMKKILMELKIQGYKYASLAVQKMNYAVRMYKKVGFEIIDENDEEYIMVCRL